MIKIPAMKTPPAHLGLYSLGAAGRLALATRQSAYNRQENLRGYPLVGRFIKSCPKKKCWIKTQKVAKKK